MPILVGSSGPRMLAATLPHVQAWNAWYTDTENAPAGVARMRSIVDAACAEAGVEPSSIERTVAVQVRLPGGDGRISVYSDKPVPPLTGSAEDIAVELRAYAREGIGHVQLVLDPITQDSIAALAPVLELLDA
jgi:hypothetical protein